MQQTFKEAQGEWALEKYKKTKNQLDLYLKLYKKTKLKYNKMIAQNNYNEQLLVQYQELVEEYKKTNKNLLKEIEKFNERK